MYTYIYLCSLVYVYIHSCTHTMYILCTCIHKSDRDNNSKWILEYEVVDLSFHSTAGLNINIYI